MFKKNVDGIKKYIGDAGTKEVSHIKNKTLYDHLCRVGNILSSWGLDDHVVFAGLCHSLYSTEFFKKEIFSIRNRELLQSGIGIVPEELVYYFAIIKRNTIFFLEKEEKYTFETIHGEKENVSRIIGDGLIHIMLANDLDHIESSNIGSILSIFKKYQSVHNNFCYDAKKELYKIVSRESFMDSAPKKESVVFTGHSGFFVRNDTTCIAFDPWLFDSQREAPLIQGFDPTQFTIDYMIPSSRHNPKDIAPDVICLSHFHTHHAPLKEIIEFLKIKPLQIVCPTLDEIKLHTLKIRLGEYMYNRITFHFISGKGEVIFPGIKILFFQQNKNTTMPHFIYYVTVGKTKVMHVVDAGADQNGDSKKLSSFWNVMHDLSPDFLFVGIADHSVRMIKNGVRVILENTSLSSVQAANLAVLTGAKCVVPIGIYNHSVWDDRYEMGQSVSDAENRLVWALGFLAPSIQVKKALPGDVLQ